MDITKRFRSSRRFFIANIMVFTILAAGIMTTPAAHASHDDPYAKMQVRTTDGNPGGVGRLYEGQWGINSENGINYVSACDIQADGYRAVMRVYRQYGYWHLETRHDAASGSGTCTPREQLYMGDGVQIKMTVCLQDGYYGTPKFCNTRYATT